MPPWKQLRSVTGSDDNWEARAVSLAAQLDAAAEELRSLAESIRRDSLNDGEEGETDERPKS
jgi:hypothetical protein